MELDGGSVIVLTGPPGSGKSTLAHSVAEHFSLSVHLVADEFFHFLSSGYIPPYLPSAEKQNQVVTEVIAHAACGYAQGGYTVISDGILGPWFLPGLLHIAEEHSIPVHYVVLRPDRDTALARAQQRQDPSALTLLEPLQAMYSQFVNLGPLESFVIDNSSLNAQETIDAIVTGLSQLTFLQTTAST